MEHAQRILDAAPGDLDATLEQAIAPSLWAELGRDGVRARADQLRDALEGATLNGARPSSPTALAMVFSHPSGERRLLLELEAEAPHRLTGLELERGAAPAAAPPQSEPEGYAEVDALARNLVGFLARGELQTAVRRTTAPRLRERYGDAELTRVLGEVRSALGGENEEFSFREVEADGEDLWVHVDVAGRDEMRFRVFVTEDAPYLIRGIDTRPTPVVHADDVTPDEWPDRIRDFVDERVRRGEFSGAVAVGRRGEPLLAEAWGIADAETGRPVTVHTPLNLGSMNKMFTGLALAQVEAEGGVDFDDTVGEYLPDYPNASIREEATLHQLLTHTAGIPGYWNSAYVAARDTITTLAGFIDTFATEPLLFEPGTEWGYSNGGPVVAGRILEVATGESYYDYVRSHIYGPAGMTDSDHYPRPDPDGRIAIGYEAIVEGEPRGPNTANMGGIGSPAGGGYSTVLDLVRFAGALDRGTLLDPEALETVWSPPRQGPESERYGYLWSSGTTAGHRWVGHNGGGPGVSADFRYFPETGHVIVVLSNVSGGAMPVSNWITELVAAHLDPFDQSLPGGARAARPGAAHSARLRRANRLSQAIRRALVVYGERRELGLPTLGALFRLHLLTHESADGSGALPGLGGGARRRLPAPEAARDGVHTLTG